MGDLDQLGRRHLTAGQRALIALDVLPLMAAEAKERQRLSKGRGKKVAEKCAPLGKASAAAAKAARTNTTYVEMAKVVQATAPELIDHIRSGELTVPDARQIATLLPDQRKMALRQLRQGNKQPNGNGTPFVFGSRTSKPNIIHTPPGVCQFLYDLISPVYEVKTILDPSAGEIALTKPWKKRKVISFEISNGKDFFESPGPAPLTACSGKDLEHIFIVPTTGAAFHGHAVFLGMLLQQRQGKAIQPSEVFSLARRGCVTRPRDKS